MTIGTISLIVGVGFLILLSWFLKGEESSGHEKGLGGVDQDELFKEEPEFDRTWSFLPGNIFHRSDED